MLYKKNNIMNVLIISANTFPLSPSGPAYISGSACDIGHTVEVFDCLVVQDPIPELEEHVRGGHLFGSAFEK